MIKIRWFVITLGLSHLAFAGGVNIGSAGDWRKTLLKNAKRGSSYWVNSVALNLNFVEEDPNLSRESSVYKFLTKPNALVSLATDIINSSHIYDPEINRVNHEYTSCAWTNDPSLAKMTDIVFSLKLCQGGLEQDGQNFANRLLIHESIHHLLLDSDLRKVIGAEFDGDLPSQKQQEDELCDEIAEAIQKYSSLVLLLDKNHWLDIAMPLISEQENLVLQSRGFHASAWTGQTTSEAARSKLIVWGGCNEGTGGLLGCGPKGYLGDGGIYDSKKNEWKSISPINAPTPRSEAASVWTGEINPSFKNKFVVWGGCVDGDGCEKKLGDGGIYDMESNHWKPMSLSLQSPEARIHHSLVWTGKEILVWGGHPQDYAPKIAQPLNNGAAYNPATDTWEEIAPAIFSDGTPFAPRGHHHSLWIQDSNNQNLNNKMLVWGGCAIAIGDFCPKSFNDGATYDPTTKVWRRLSTSGLMPKSRYGESFTYVPSQKKIYVFGGYDDRGTILSDGAVLDLISLTWSPMANMASGRAQHSAVWANGQLLVFGGVKNNFAGIKDFEDLVLSYCEKKIDGKIKGQWKVIATDELVPLKTMHHTAVWTGEAMIVWGGQTSDQQFNNLGAKLYLGEGDEAK